MAAATATNCGTAGVAVDAALAVRLVWEWIRNNSWFYCVTLKCYDEPHCFPPLTVTFGVSMLLMTLTHDMSDTDLMRMAELPMRKTTTIKRPTVVKLDTRWKSFVSKKYHVFRRRQDREGGGGSTKQLLFVMRECRGECLSHGYNFITIEGTGKLQRAFQCFSLELASFSVAAPFAAPAQASVLRLQAAVACGSTCIISLRCTAQSARCRGA
ncbi:hypothetical protein Pelo_18865 [Pelomyxa schiedti]|nr:hypothetical protein Pelo_18865 [Pelomyxa schiedti]